MGDFVQMHFGLLDGQEVLGVRLWQSDEQNPLMPPRPNTYDNARHQLGLQMCPSLATDSFFHSYLMSCIPPILIRKAFLLDVY